MLLTLLVVAVRHALTGGTWKSNCNIDHTAVGLAGSSPHMHLPIQRNLR